TDANGVFAVDTWAKQQDCAILNPENIKVVSAKLLAGEQVLFSAPWAVQGQPPVGVALTESDNCDIQLTLQSGRNAVQSKALRLVPRCAVLGIGCKKGTPQAEIEAAVTTLFETEHLALQALCGVCSIDLKKDEPGLLAFCAAHRVPFDTFTAEQLCSVAGEFSSSEFVQRITGVDNVCERSAVLGSGGRLIVHKHSGNGVTLAVALKPFHPNWRW
ncbi:MAG: cobalamin biosynthesis protein, partial [Pygmaiobacter sp.]